MFRLSIKLSAKIPNIASNFKRNKYYKFTLLKFSNKNLSSNIDDSVDKSSGIHYRSYIYLMR